MSVASKPWRDLSDNYQVTSKRGKRKKEINDSESAKAFIFSDVEGVQLVSAFAIASSGRNTPT